MALPPELDALKEKLQGIPYVRRSPGQNRLLDELEDIDRKIMDKSIGESTNTRMTSPGSGSCSCCGR